MDLVGALDVALNSRATRLPASKLTANTWDFRAGGGDLAERLLAAKPSLADITARIFQGLVSGADDVFYLQRSGSRCFSRALDEQVHVEAELLHPLLKGSVHIKRYSALPTDLYTLFPYRHDAGQAALLGAREFEDWFPKGWSYLTRCRRQLEAREHGKWKHERWYAYGRSQALSVVSLPKILTPSIANESSFLVDADGEFFFTGSGGGGGGGYGLLLKEGCPMSMQYVCAVLNSAVLEWLVRVQSTNYRGGYFAFNRQYIERLPIPAPDLNDKVQRGSHDRLVEATIRLSGLR